MVHVKSNSNQLFAGIKPFCKIMDLVYDMIKITTPAPEACRKCCF